MSIFNPGIMMLLALAIIWLLIEVRKTRIAQRKQWNDLLKIVSKQYSDTPSPQKEIYETWHLQANHNSACLHYILAALRPYLFNVLETAVRNEHYEDAAVCKEMIRNIDLLISTDFTKIKPK